MPRPADRPVPLPSPDAPRTVWALTTGEAGMRAQARGLAEALDRAEVTEKIIGLRAPWRLLPGALAPAPLHGLDPSRDALTPPWPDLVISCGRRSTAAAIAVRKASQGRTRIVHVQNPRTRLSAFDLVVAMEHDRIAGPNVLNVPTALHGMTPDALTEAGRRWRARFADLPRPLLGVLVGGSTRHDAFTADHAAALAETLLQVRRATRGALFVTPSRRTPSAALAVLRRALVGEPHTRLWNGEGDNPYLGLLALADRLVVTSDSVSMISEALATPHPVEVFDLGARRHARFLKPLLDRGLVRRFTADSEAPPSRVPLNATTQAAAAVEQLLQARTGLSG